MKTKRHTMRLLLLLLTLLPRSSAAQQLAGYEYWFDGDVSNRTFVGLSGTEADIDANIATDGLANGLHTLFLRFRQSGGDYGYSPITTAQFFKVNLGADSKIEYWIDGDYEGTRKTVSAHVASTSDAIISTEAFDLSNVSAGMHRVYYRLVGSDGITCSAVSMTPVMVGGGETTQLEYWFDGQRNDETVNTITGHAAASGDAGTIFNDTLALTSLSEGMHRMYYRGVNSNGVTSTAVSMTPVMVKSRYNFDSIEPKVVKYSVSVDNEEPMILDVLTPKNEITIPYTFDARELSTGNHTLKAKVWNNAYAGVSIEQFFNVKAVETPSSTLTATEKDGLVMLQFNYVPNNKRYKIVRVDESGTTAKVHEALNGTWSLNGDSYTDDPPAGNYTYYVLTVYKDANGNQQVLKSNEVAVYVAKAQEDINNCGWIVGFIQQNFVSSKWATIEFSDGVSVSCEDGKFHRERIPAGTELTLTVKSGVTSSLALTYEPVTITIKPGENFVSIKGQSLEDIAPNNYDCDLTFDSDIEWIGQEFKFRVKNWTKKTWKGKVRFRAITEKKEKELGESEEDDDSSLVGAGSVATMPGLPVENNYYYSLSEELTIESGKTAFVTLSLENVFPDTKKDYYKFYIESYGKWTTYPNDQMQIKPVAINYDYNITENPFKRLIDKSSLSKAEDQVLMQNVEAAANLILMVCSKVKAFDGILGNIEEYCDALAKETKKLGNPDFDLAKLNNYVEHALETETIDELLTDDMFLLLPKAVLGNCGSAIMKKFRENIKDDILDSAWDPWTFKDIIKGSKCISEYLGKAMKVVKAIETYKEWDNMSTYDRHFYCAEAILNYTDKYNPFSKVLHTYLDVGEAMIRKALEYGEEYYGHYNASLLYENIPSVSESDKFEYNKFVNFKIQVQTNKLVYYNFSKPLLGNGTYQIQEVKVMLSNKSVNEVDTIYFQPLGMWNGVYLKQTKYVGVDPMTGGGNIDFGYKLKRFWMEIKWRNGRVTKVPLLNTDGNGVDFEPYPNKPYEYTIKLKSGTTKYDHIADIIELKE